MQRHTSYRDFRAGDVGARLCAGDVRGWYASWPSPTVIISDGPYGVAGYPGDPASPDGLADAYADHVQAWSAAAKPYTTLWFWCTEVGWAEVHPLLKQHGWSYEQTIIWDKGVAHVAGNVNGDTIRGVPVVTEICARYVRRATLPGLAGGEIPLRDWLREEWRRTGLPWSSANEACGVAAAATRKWLTADDLWYFPPEDAFLALAAHANQHGDPAGRPYFDLSAIGAGDARSAVGLGKAALPSRKIAYRDLRARWHHEHGVTNVWRNNAVRGQERMRDAGGATIHPNQKPAAFMARQVAMSSDPGEVVWEPFGGLCTASAAALELGRNAYACEIRPEVYPHAAAMLTAAAETLRLPFMDARAV